ncbi:allatotropin-like isoform X2 [Bicyclus anynana]|uniref:Allatotropin-like isoform X2 n=1 Tax=Bicyclus anynana TaxID=110368 RepID=A0A6J1P1G7_BICAN|nr:allatotropin-like isoform X2 [Bicyclus anynana]
MNTTVYLALVVAACLCSTEGAPEVRLTRKQQRPTRGFKNLEMMTARGFGKRAERDVDSQTPSERTNRGTPTFKSPSVGIARDFGKRTSELDSEEEEIRVTRGTFKPNANVLIARGYGKRQEAAKSEVYGMDNFWENLEAAQEKDGQDADQKTLQSIPLDWFVNEMVNNPDFARSVVRKFIDLNQDGMLSSEELLRNV